ncbi:metallophosphoesterase [uncultured Microbacterium sp.]|uniref:metallophosphoesterase n=1 Tax=uncultured Microbacterium sp. TaxID=191216 RepID=UPI0025E81CB4|nr:metallophosphoesterase [uncultured Microbacterium sp.]
MTPASRALTTAAALTGAAAVGAAVWGIGIERHLYTLRTVEVPALAPGSAPVRVLHVSDAHMAPWQHRKQRWIASLALLEPDLVVNTGDNLGHTDALEGITRAFAPFRGVPGVFVRGSNDLFEPKPRNPLRYVLGPSKRVPKAKVLDTDAMNRFFVDELGWHDLDNQASVIRLGDRALHAIGLSDAHHERDDEEAMDASASTLPRDDRAVATIGVTHAPYIRTLDAMTDAGADVLFAGHTHGGQVRVPFSPSALVANCDLPRDQARGASTWHTIDREVPLHVSAGIGHSIYAPVRFACRPEASLVTLVARPE